MQAVEITIEDAMRQLKIFLSIYYFSLPDEGGENKIYQFLSFSVYFWKFWLRQGGLSFYGSQKGDEGADTDLMFQFCLPYLGLPKWYKTIPCSPFSSLSFHLTTNGYFQDRILYLPRRHWRISPFHHHYHSLFLRPYIPVVFSDMRYCNTCGRSPTRPVLPTITPEKPCTFLQDSS